MGRLRNPETPTPIPRSLLPNLYPQPVDRYFGVTETTKNTRAGSDMGEAIGGAADGSPPLQGEFFVCDFFDPAPKGDLGTMEHPVFSLATRPDRRILEYTHNGVEVTVTPSVKGRATIHDKDILIFCISQLMAAINAGRDVSRTLQLTAHDLLTATRRDTSGRRLPPIARRLRAAGGHAHHHQHHHRRRRGDPGLRPDRSLVDRAPHRAGRMVASR
jgi:hypothetical protein